MSGRPGLSANARNKSFRAMRVKFAIEILPFVHGTIWRRRAILVLLIISIDRYKNDIARSKCESRGGNPAARARTPHRDRAVNRHRIANPVDRRVASRSDNAKSWNGADSA